MKILVISDQIENSLWSHNSHCIIHKTGAELIISCGDLPVEYLEFLVSTTRLPLLYVPGNHDQKYAMHPPKGCRNIDGKVASVGGLEIAGLGGSQRYKDAPYQYTEREMAARIRKLNRRLRRERSKTPLDLLITHAPAAGYGDLPDPAHQGFQCFNDFLMQNSPRLMLHGHVHPEYCTDLPRKHLHPSGTLIYNCCGTHLIEI